MAIEIAAGHLFGSMALLAEGWHMGTHAAEYRERIRIHVELVHFNLEVAHCDCR